MTDLEPDHPPLTRTTIARIETYVLRCPIDTPVRTSFGVMHERPALFVKVVDRDGATGWGEVWCNFRHAAPSIVRPSSNLVRAAAARPTCPLIRARSSSS